MSGPGSWLPWLVALLVIFAFVQAFLLFPVLFGPGEEVEGLFQDVDLPEERVRILVGRGDPAFVLKTPFDLPDADLRAAQELDRGLFPGGDRHRYYHLHAIHSGEGGVVVDLAREPVLLADEEGRTWAPVDLEKVVREREGELSPYLRFYLSSLIPAGGRFTLAPGGRRTVLVAYRAEDAPAVPADARIGERLLSGETMRKDEVDRCLEWPSLLRERPGR